MAKTPDGFVPLSSVRTPDRPAADIIADIRNLYFKTSAKTIEQDFVHAIALLMSLENEDARDKAAVYMEGLNEMRAEWAKAGKRTTPPSGTKAAKATRHTKPDTSPTSTMRARPAGNTAAAPRGPRPSRPGRPPRKTR